MSRRFDSSLIPQPSVQRHAERAEELNDSGSIGAEPVAAIRHWSRPIRVSTACLTPSGSARTAAGVTSGSAPRQRGVQLLPGPSGCPSETRVDLSRDFKQAEVVRAVGQRGGCAMGPQWSSVRPVTCAIGR